ncbi:multidrug resistance protein, MATE family [Roseovarius azorensis]|uniref:Multidrug resistance protein, MATE family n=1 Tax=Roseovarius azorensis TaxID=1287727 RepID=A0A1H7JQC0_9RHOB|nr:MATE family efflux transporter [Roseovarius azorensis]SEK76819.1 multidrug resistance protein, MATE family [Roseovarius azorensis]
MAEAVRSITHGRVLKIALPIVISNATVPILGAVDTGVVGQLGLAAPIGAVGIGAVILTGIYWIFGFLRMGTTGLTSQAHGAGQVGEVAALLTRALMIGFAGGLVIIILQAPVFWAAFQLAPASDEVETLARQYMAIRVWSAPAMIALFGMTGWLIAQERTRAVLAIQVLMNGINILLDLWFVLGLDWGVAGVARATVLAEWGGLALGFWFCRDAFGVPAWRDWPRVFDPERLRNMASVNTDILLRSLMLEGIVISFLFLGSDFGDVTLAANQVLLQFLHITAHALDGFAFAAEALVGQAVGARNRAALRQGALRTSQWGLGIIVLLAVAFALWGGALIDLMAKAHEVQQEARVYLIYMVFAPILGLAAWMFDGIFIGATRTRDMRNMMAVSLVIYVISVIALVPLIGNHGLWVALLISYVARGMTLALRYPALERATVR